MDIFYHSISKVFFNAFEIFELLFICYMLLEEGVEGELREKRQVEQYEYTPSKTRCPLLLVADYRFYQEMGASNTKTTINYLVRFIHYFTR